MKNQLGLIIKYERTKQGVSQTKLAKDICSVSYLSKIENLETDANNEILRKLINNLGYTLQDNEKIVTKFRNESIEFWNRYFEFDTSHIIGEEAKSFSFEDESLLFSECGIDFLLVKMFKKTFLDNLRLEDVEVLRLFQDHFTDRQQYQLDIILLQIKTKNKIWLSNNDLKLIDSYGNADYLVSHALFDQRQYDKSVHFALKSYDTFASKGNVMGMLHSTLLMADCYNNLGQLNKHLEESSKILRINRFIKNPNFDKAAYLNIGSIYLLNSNFELAIKYLNASLNIHTQRKEQDIKIIEKLAFANALNKNTTQSKELMDSIKNLVASENVLNIVREINDNSNYVQSVTYQKNLELVFNSIGEEDTSRKNFFGGLLYLVYKKTYNYNKALKLSEYFRKFESIPFNT